MFLQFKQTTINLILLKGYSCGGGGAFSRKINISKFKKSAFIPLFIWQIFSHYSIISDSFR
ncbi:hypothetical protein [Helicobacter sp. UBA3407]|uniref:hypothetical protein n=1 Tax=Helicobacter TaxID=209 RepID=UPI00260811D5|nr:hypothetical protein [Helicobacter sp. UBA3407]